MKREDSIPVITEIKKVLTEHDWFAFDGTRSNPNGSNTDTHIKMTRILWDDEEEFDGDENRDIYFDEDEGDIVAEHYDGDGTPSLFFINDGNLEKGRLEKRFCEVFSR